jgi:predicted nucleotidyltransferase component of viral defense system
MSEAIPVPHDVALSAWVDEAKADAAKHLERQVTEILLHAIGITETLNQTLVLKGGVLMSLVHGSYRYTGDVDFTAIVDPTPYADLLKAELNRALPRATADLGITDIVCAVQRFDYKPRQKGFTEFTAPALKLSIGYAKKDTRDEVRLSEGKSTRILEVDISFKEKVLSISEINIEETDVKIQAYDFEEIIAEKMRATIQQVNRERNRRQDIFDIRWLVERYKPDDHSRNKIVKTLIEKSEDRDIFPNADSFEDKELKERSSKEWDTLKLEVGGKLPDFEESFEIVRGFYRSLPWDQG